MTRAGAEQPTATQPVGSPGVASPGAPAPEHAVAAPATHVSTRDIRAAQLRQDEVSRSRRPGRRRIMIPARLRIMAWLVLLLFIALVTVVVVTRNLLLAEAERSATEALEQETAEFQQAAARGLDPITQRPFVDGRDLLESHIQRQYTDDDEILLGVTADGAIIPQPGREPVALASRDNRLEPILASPLRSDVLETRDGRLRWSKVPILLPDGSQDGTFIVAYAIDQRAADVAATVRLLVLVSGIGLLLAAAASWVVSGQILEPVNAIRRTAAEITHDDLTRRIPVHGNDDIAALSDQFNAMVDRLEQAFGAQRRFLDDASHELRTPITIIRGNLEFIEDDDPRERAEVVRLCTDELDRMSRIVEDLLLLAKSRRPDFVQPHDVGLVDLVSDIDAKLRALGDRRWQLEAIAEGDGRLDAQRITQAVVQLAHNAVQHTGPGDVIALGSAAEGREVVFWVRDTGAGVAPEDGEAIFRRFSRGSTAGVRAHRTGAGLGLSIVTAIAEAHGGWVELDSTPGRGATFTVRLPQARVTEPTDSAGSLEPATR